MAILLCLGCCDVYEFVYPDQVPEIHPASELIYLKALINTSSNQSKTMCPEECWMSLQPTLEILDKVCPEVSQWARETHANNKIEWINSSQVNFYALYNVINGRVRISKHFLLENDGKKASILAHEFRHSRQGSTKFFKATVSYLLGHDPNESVMELDAQLFEHQIYLAIFR